MRQRRDNYFAIFFVIYRASSNATPPGIIDLSNFLFRRNDLRRGRIIRRLYVGQQIRNAGFRVVEHVDARTQNFIKVVRRDVSRHTPVSYTHLTLPTKA